MTQLPAQILTATKHRDAPRLTGYIDAITEDRIFGWAWDPQRADTRLAIRVEVDGKAVATAVADQPREDLASNGVGDGGHAFEIVIASGITPEKVTVFALCSETGESLELTHRPLAGALAADSRSEELRGVVHALCRSQRLLSGKVQTVVDAIQSLRSDDAAKAAEGSHSSRLDALEVAVARMDERLREHGHSIDALKQRPQDQISRVLSYAALAVAGAALVISMTW